MQDYRVTIKRVMTHYATIVSFGNSADEAGQRVMREAESGQLAPEWDYDEHTITLSSVFLEDGDDDEAVAR